jgi:hypothetical protein
MNERISAARMALALILPLAVAACSGSSDGKASGNDGGSKDSGAAGDANPTTGGTAQIKFCNGLSLQNNGNLRLSLQVGDPPVVMTANSGECSTPTGTPCKTVPAGMNPVHLVDDMNQDVASGTVTIGAGEQWMMLATISNTTGGPTVIGGALKAQYTCSTVDPFMVPDGGMEPVTPDGGAGQ